MASPAQTLPAARRWTRRLLIAGLSLALAGTTWLSTPAQPAAADPATTPRSGNFYVSGAGFGHGWGMSQYGAYGAARRGLSWTKILAFYYPKTVRKKLPADGTIKVWITRDSDGSLTFKGTSGARVSDGARSYALPTGSAYAYWRIARSGSGYRLSYRSAGGGWRTKSTGLGSNTWKVTAGRALSLVLPGGSVRPYRGSLSLIKRGSSGRTVNTVSMEDYVRGVVPAEMPTSWLPDAVKAQAVAARTYGAFLRDRSNTSGYDICDTTACQVYGGASRETANGDDAVEATAHQVMTYGDKPAFTQFTSSNGGQITTGDFSYQIAQRDPYDGVVKDQTWNRTISASRLGRAFGVGTARRVQIIKRDGYGRWGGRVSSIKITGTKRSVTVTGTRFKGAFGMRSNYFTVNGTSSSGKPQPPVQAPDPGPDPVTAPPTKVPAGKAYVAFPRTYRPSTSRTDLLFVTGGGQLERRSVTATKIGTGEIIDHGYGSFTHVVGAGDWNGDGRQDVVARNKRNRLILYRGTTTGSFNSGTDLGVTAKYRYLAGAGDVNGDRHPDLVAITASGKAYVLRGNGGTGISKKVRLSGNWSGHDWLRGAGDFNADGHEDLITRRSGRLYVWLGTKAGTFAAAKSIGVGFGQVAAISTVGDITGDGRADVVARSASGRLRLYRSTGSALKNSTSYAGGFGGTRFVL